MEKFKKLLEDHGFLVILRDDVIAITDEIKTRSTRILHLRGNILEYFTNPSKFIRLDDDEEKIIKFINDLF